MADFMRNSAIKGMTSILRADMKYTRLFAKIAFKSIPAKSIPVTIMLAGPIIFPTLEMVFVMSSGSRILVKINGTNGNGNHIDVKDDFLPVIGRFTAYDFLAVCPEENKLHAHEDTSVKYPFLSQNECHDRNNQIAGVGVIDRSCFHFI